LRRDLIGTTVAVIIRCIGASVGNCAFEDIGMGARPLGMGGTFAASADGADAIFWNPAGVASTQSRELTMSYVELYGLVSYSALGYAHRMESASAGIGIVSSSDVDGAYQENALALSAAKEITHGLSLGANVKYLSSTASTGDMRIGGGRGLALDLGFQYRMLDDMVFLGASSQNLLSYVSYSREAVKDIPGNSYSENLDISYRAGAKIDLELFSPLVQDAALAADFSDGDVHVGAEYIFREIIAVRAGFRSGNALTRSITGGFGLMLSAFRLDYAYVGSEVGAQTSQFSLSVNW